jgi:tight adherence protein B
VGTSAFILLIAEFILSPRHRIARRVRNASRARAGRRESGSSLFRDWDVSDDSHSQNVLNRLSLLVDQSGLPVSVRQVLLSSLCLGAVFTLAGLLWANWGWLMGAVGAGLPFAYLVGRRNRRVAQLRRQLPEALDVMRRAVEAGQSVSIAMQQVAMQCRNPLAAEFQHTHEQQNLGLSFDASLRDLALRIPVTELHILLMALLFNRQSGGSPVEILGNVSGLLRKRQRASRRIHSLTAEGRMQAVVLTVLPIIAFVGLWLLRPDYIKPLTERPQLLASMIALQLTGTLWIRNIIRLDY